MRTRTAIALLLLGGLLMAAPATAFTTTFDSGAIRPGEEFSHTFTEENEWGFYYNCKFHANPESMVHVSADSDGATTSIVITIKNDASGQTIFTQQHATIEVGDTVVWKNIEAADSGISHTVTYDEAKTDAEYALGTGHDNSDGHHDNSDGHHDEDKGSPGFEIIAVIAAIGAVLALRRK